MPQLGIRDGDTVGVLQATRAEAPQVAEFHRNRNQMMVPERSEPLIEVSQQLQVYIYNVGPKRFQQELGSYGSMTVPGLPEEQVFKGLAVAGPLVIPGLPWEPYPSEGEAKVIDHRPPKNQGLRSKNPGYDFAMEVCGRGRMVSKSCDLYPYGVFISEQPEQSQPRKNASEDDIKAFARWKNDVETAQKMLRAKCSLLCQEANQEYARGNFREVRSDDLYMFARLINGTELQYGWLKDSGDKADNKSCWSCGTVIKGFALKCGQCGEPQVSEAEMNAERERRFKTTL